MMMLMIVGLFISLNSYASEWSLDYCYKKHVDDPRAVVIGDEDPYNLSQSAPSGSKKNPLYNIKDIKEPEPALRKVKSETKAVNFSWDTEYELKEDSPAFKKKKIGLMKKVLRSLDWNNPKFKNESSTTRN